MTTSYFSLLIDFDGIEACMRAVFSLTYLVLLGVQSIACTF